MSYYNLFYNPVYIQVTTLVISNNFMISVLILRLVALNGKLETT